MGKRTKLKICGLTRVEEISFINRVRPDYVGFVMAESKRKIDEEQAVRLKNLIHPDIVKVGVFVDDYESRILSLLENGVIDAVQLHGSEDENYIRHLKSKTNKTIIKAYIVKENTDVEEIKKTSADYILLDAGKGSGKRLDWDRIAAFDRPYFLAGGINPENVAEAVNKCHPYCIDVSSGVEKNGIKDSELINSLIKNMGGL